MSQVELGIETNFWPKDDGPRDVIPLAELPMLASGKVDRQSLLEGVR